MATAVDAVGRAAPVIANSEAAARREDRFILSLMLLPVVVLVLALGAARTANPALAALRLPSTMAWPTPQPGPPGRAVKPPGTLALSTAHPSWSISTPSPPHPLTLPAGPPELEREVLPEVGSGGEFGQGAASGLDMAAAPDAGREMARGLERALEVGAAARRHMGGESLAAAAPDISVEPADVAANAAEVLLARAPDVTSIPVQDQLAARGAGRRLGLAALPPQITTQSPLAQAGEGAYLTALGQLPMALGSAGAGSGGLAVGLCKPVRLAALVGGGRGTMRVGRPEAGAGAMSVTGAAFGKALSDAALAQTRELVIYTAAYQRIAYPGGDIDPMFGSCSDVVIRAYRELGIDLQALVKAGRFGSGDTNIDHRRTETLRRLFTRAGASLPVTPYPEAYRPGDIVTYYRPFSRISRAHVAIVSDVIAPTGRPMIVHNRGWGPQLEDALFADRITGHYRFRPAPTALAVAAIAPSAVPRAHRDQALRVAAGRP